MRLDRLNHSVLSISYPKGLILTKQIPCWVINSLLLLRNKNCMKYAWVLSSQKDLLLNVQGRVWGGDPCYLSRDVLGTKYLKAVSGRCCLVLTPYETEVLMQKAGLDALYKPLRYVFPSKTTLLALENPSNHNNEIWWFSSSTTNLTFQKIKDLNNISRNIYLPYFILPCFL